MILIEQESAYKTVFIFTAIYYRQCVLLSKTELNHNTYLFRLQLPHGAIMHVPVGKHVYLKARVQGKEPGRLICFIMCTFPSVGTGQTIM